MRDKSKGSQFPSIEDIAEVAAEVVYRKGFREIVTFEEMVDFALENKKRNAKIAAFVVSVKKNYDPQTENDKFIVMQGFLDKNNKIISLDGKEAESRIIHTRTIDKKFIEVLDGFETKIIRF